MPANEPPVVIARGERPGWYLLDAGTDTAGVPLARVADTANHVIYPPYRYDLGDVTGRRGWRRPTGTPDSVDPAGYTEADPPSVVAHQGGSVYLLRAGFDGSGWELGQILDLTTGRLYSPAGIAATLKHGGWEDFDLDDEPIVAAAQVATAVHPATPPGPRGRRVSRDELAARARRRSLAAGDPASTGPDGTQGRT